MATTYKTPGVYVEEIVKFPPSVAQVETAIPAFIGYTEKASKKLVGDLNGIPTRINSMLEYETYYGFAQPETTINVTINDTLVDGGKETSIIVDHPTTRSPFLMYYSMQMFFANGGGPCYIVSVGRYGNERKDAEAQVTGVTGPNDFKAGLDELEKYDEPTLIVFPDATGISSVDDFYTLYKDALTQCNKLQDRFTIIDTHTYETIGSTDANIDVLREKINSEKDYLKYGAVYYPFLKTILDYHYNTEDVILNHYSYDADAFSKIKENLAIIQDVLTGISPTVTSLFDYSTPGFPNGAVSGAVSDVLFQMYDPGAGFDLGGTFNTDATKKTAFLNVLDTLVTDLGNLVALKNDLNEEATAAASTIDEDPAIKVLIENAQAALNVDFDGDNKIDQIYDNLLTLQEKMLKPNAKQLDLLNVNAVNFDAELQKLVVYVPLAVQSPVSEPVTLFGNINANVTALVTEINKVEGLDKNNGILNGRSLSDSETVDNATYNKIITEINSLPLELPPSSAMAGIYARVDGDRGVWKAPANVGVNYVIEPSRKVTHDEQRDLNVHTTGKSVNAIRSFTGKGILVWGSRTLAGNDNEWRYVPVRRFFNMVEESVEKAVEPFVFEPNDANTWVRVRSMIENFLTLQWRAGALAGAKPEHAFYVKVGLGETMTADDILNGIMNVEIGMAAVRPAEFIILKFSHKMQEA